MSFPRSPAQLTRRLASFLRLVNASELERLKKRFMKLDRCFFLSSRMSGRVSTLTSCIVFFDSSVFPPLSPSHRNNHLINHSHAAPYHQSLIPPPGIDGTSMCPNVSTVIQRWLWFDRPRRVLANPPDRWEPPRFKDDCNFRRRVRPHSPFPAAASISATNPTHFDQKSLVLLTLC